MIHAPEPQTEPQRGTLAGFADNVRALVDSEPDLTYEPSREGRAKGREALGLSPQQLARILAVAPSSVMNMEKGGDTSDFVSGRVLRRWLVASRGLAASVQNGTAP